MNSVKNAAFFTSSAGLIVIAPFIAELLAEMVPLPIAVGVNVIIPPAGI
jgi:hypothetical protein